MDCACTFQLYATVEIIAPTTLVTLPMVVIIGTLLVSVLQATGVPMKVAIPLMDATVCQFPVSFNAFCNQKVMLTMNA